MKKLSLVIILVLGISMLTGCSNDAVNSTELPAEKASEESVEGVDETLEVDENTEETSDASDMTPNEEAEDEATEPAIEEPEEPEIDLTGKAINPLTGLYIDEEVAARRPYGVMFSNIYTAFPHSGISQADVVYEALVEGKITRLFALFQDFDAEKIGPVRSSRHYYLDFALDFDAAYVHFGGSPQAYEAIKSLNIPTIDGIYSSSEIFYRSNDRVAPHNAYTSFDGVMLATSQRGYRSDRRDDLENKLVFAEDEILLETGNEATKLTMNFFETNDSRYQSYSPVEDYSWFEYNDTTKLYERYQFDVPHVDVINDEQLVFDNIIVQFVSTWVIPGDEAGRRDMTTIGSGEGYYFTRGKYIPISWSKASHYEPTMYYDANGDILELNTGKTWITLYPNDRMDYFEIQ